MRKWILSVTVVAAVVGAVLGGMSTSSHFRIMREGFENESFCAISDTINCDIVNSSSYSTFFGAPIAWWGLTFYVLIAAMSLFSMLSKSARRDTISAAWFMSLASIVYSAYLYYIAAYVLGVFCIECIGMYVVNAIIFVTLFIAMKISPLKVIRFIIDYAKAAFGRQSKLGFAPNILWHAFVIAFVFGTSWIIIFSASAEDERTARMKPSGDQVMRAFDMESEYLIDVDSQWAVWGNPDAKVKIVEFSEFQCPFCRIAAFNVKPFLAEFKKDVAFYFVNYPLDSSCNKGVAHQMHPFACMAARAGICSKKMGDFWGYHDDVFRNQQKLSEELLLDLAIKRGWNKEEFRACMNSDDVEAQLQKDIAAADRIHIHGTPSVFIDNRKLAYWRDPKVIQDIVKREIKRNK